METRPKSNRLKQALGPTYENHPPYFQEYLRKYEQDPTSRVFAPLAETYRRMGRLEEAIQLCKEGLERHPDFHGGRVALARCLMDCHRFEEAQKELERVTQVVPENLMAQKLLGQCAENSNFLEKALHAYKMALLMAPDDVFVADKVRVLEQRIWKSENTPVEKSNLWGEEEDSKPPKTAVPAKSEWDLEPVSPEMPTLTEEEEKSSPGQEFVLEEDEDPDSLDSISEENLHSHQIDTLLASSPEASALEESFQVEHVSHVFEDQKNPRSEITTETLADLYMEQEQYQKALQILEKVSPTPVVEKKIQLCKMELGVDPASQARYRKITKLRTVLKKIQK